MEELPLAVQLKLQSLPGREEGFQVLDLVLDDGEVIEAVEVFNCMYVEDPRLEAHLVADVFLPEEPNSPWQMVLFWALVVGGIVFMFWAIAQIRPV